MDNVLESKAVSVTPVEENTPKEAAVGKRSAISILLMVILFQVGAWVTPDYVLPGWGPVLQSFAELNYNHVWVSVLRLIFALVAAFMLGYIGATLLYSWQKLEEYVMPIIHVVLAIPALSWVIFSILWFRGLETRIAFVLVIVCAPVYLVDLLDGMKNVPRDLREMVLALRPTRMEYFSKLIFPCIMPAILTSWKVNISLAVRVITVAELVGAVSGIGYGLMTAQEIFDISQVFAWTIILILILMAMNYAIVSIERRTLRWRD